MLVIRVILIKYINKKRNCGGPTQHPVLDRQLFLSLSDGTNLRGGDLPPKVPPSKAWSVRSGRSGSSGEAARALREPPSYWRCTPRRRSKLRCHWLQ